MLRSKSTLDWKSCYITHSLAIPLTIPRYDWHHYHCDKTWTPSAHLRDMRGPRWNPSLVHIMSNTMWMSYSLNHPEFRRKYGFGGVCFWQILRLLFATIFTVDLWSQEKNIIDSVGLRSQYSVDFGGRCAWFLLFVFGCICSMFYFDGVSSKMETSANFANFRGVNPKI